MRGLYIPDFYFGGNVVIISLNTFIVIEFNFSVAPAKSFC